MQSSIGKWRYALLASLICCLTTTNFANLIFLPILLILLLVLKDRKARRAILGCAGIFILFNLYVSIGNISYLKQSVENTSGKVAYDPNDHSYDSNQPDTLDEPHSKQRIAAIYSRLARPNGKVLSWKETWAYATSSPLHALAGAGVGNFSSIVALQMAHIYGRRHSRFFERMPGYVHPAYRAHHYQIMNDVYQLPEGYHSARHMPHSFPNQLIGEYGLLGVLFFAFGYVWYFIRRGGGRGFFLIVMILTAGYLWFDYLFDYMSVMLFFELLFLLHHTPQNVPEHA